MTTNVPAGYGLAHAVLQLTGDPEPMTVSFGISGITDDTTALAAVQAFRFNFGLNVMPFVCNVYSLIRAEMQYREPGETLADPAHVVVDTSATVVGGNTSAATPQNSAYLVHKRTAIAGRQYRGRAYIPGVGEPSVSPTGAIIGDYVTTFPVALTEFKNDMITATYPLVLLHGDPLVGTTPQPTPITALTLDPIIATQRRRLRR